MDRHEMSRLIPTGSIPACAESLMAITVMCPKCQAPHNAPDSAAGNHCLSRLQVAIAVPVQVPEDDAGEFAEELPPEPALPSVEDEEEDAEKDCPTGRRQRAAGLDLRHTFNWPSA